MTGLCRRLAQRYAEQGLAHPLAAAAAQAGRGRHGLTVEQYARLIGVPVVELRSAEAGDVPFSELPGPLVADLARSGRIDLDALRARDEEVE